MDAGHDLRLLRSIGGVGKEVDETHVPISLSKIGGGGGDVRKVSLNRKERKERS